MKEIINVSMALEAMQAIESDIKHRAAELKTKMQNGGFDEAIKICEDFEKDYNVRFPKTFVTEPRTI